MLPDRPRFSRQMSLSDCPWSHRVPQSRKNVLKRHRLIVRPYAAQPEQVRYPTDVGQDAVPLLKRLVFPEKFRPAMQQVGQNQSGSPSRSVLVSPETFWVHTQETVSCASLARR